MDDGKAKSPSQIAEWDYQRVVHAWAMYDWANSAFAVVILTAIFPVYYRALVMDAGAAPETATAYWAYTTSLSLLLVAALGPVAGAAADLLGAKKRFLAVALWLGVARYGESGVCQHKRVSAGLAVICARQPRLCRRQYLLRGAVAAGGAGERFGSGLGARLCARLPWRRFVTRHQCALALSARLVLDGGSNCGTARLFYQRGWLVVDFRRAAISHRGRAPGARSTARVSCFRR